MKKDIFKDARFNGSDYIPEKDNVRLTGQLNRVYNLMIDGKWRTLAEIELITKDPQSSISAQLRHLRKERFGGHILNKRSRGEREKGLFEYQLLESHVVILYKKKPDKKLEKAKKIVENCISLIEKNKSLPLDKQLLEHEIIEKIAKLI